MLTFPDPVPAGSADCRGDSLLLSPILQHKVGDGTGTADPVSRAAGCILTLLAACAVAAEVSACVVSNSSLNTKI